MGKQHLKQLRAKKKKRGVPLSQVIRKDTPSPKDIENRNGQIIYQTSLVGNIFTRDSRKVIDIAKKPTLGPTTETWIKGLKCERKAMHELKDHYDGTTERTQVYRAYLKNIFYKNNTTSPFQNYVTKIKGILNMLEKYGVMIYGDKMAEHLIGHTISPNTELKT